MELFIAFNVKMKNNMINKKFVQNVNVNMVLRYINNIVKNNVQLVSNLSCLNTIN